MLKLPPILNSHHAEARCWPSTIAVSANALVRMNRFMAPFLYFRSIAPGAASHREHTPLRDAQAFLMGVREAKENGTVQVKFTGFSAFSVARPHFSAEVA